MLSASDFTMLLVTGKTYPGSAIVRIWSRYVLDECSALVKCLAPGTTITLCDGDSFTGERWEYIVPKKPRRRFKCT